MVKRKTMKPEPYPGHDLSWMSRHDFLIMIIGLVVTAMFGWGIYVLFFHTTPKEGTRSAEAEEESTINKLATDFKEKYLWPILFIVLLFLLILLGMFRYARRSDEARIIEIYRRIAAYRSKVDIKNMEWAQMNTETGANAMKTLKKRNKLQQKELGSLFTLVEKQLEAYKDKYGDEGVKQMHAIGQRAWDRAIQRRKAGMFSGIDEAVSSFRVPR